MRTDGDMDGAGRPVGANPRRTPRDYEELLGAFDDAGRLLGARQAREADAALKRAGVKGAVMWGGVGVPVLPGPVRDLISLAAKAQHLAARADGSAEDTGPLLEHLDALRSIFEHQAVQEAGAP